MLSSSSRESIMGRGCLSRWPCSLSRCPIVSTRAPLSPPVWRRSSQRPGGGKPQVADSAHPLAAPQLEEEIRPGVFQGYWQWEGFKIRYQRSGDSGDASAGPPLICVHGFGGNADHFRHTLSALGREGCRVWAVDLLGFGFSDKPDPRTRTPCSIYNFETWARQLRDFQAAFVGEPCFFICNSVGGLAGLQAALDDPAMARGVMLMNISLRMLHITKQPEWQRPLVAALQRTLRETALGPWFFSLIATPEAVRSVLRQCYANPAAVTDELVDIILRPGLEPGAAQVFLDFISYSSGPLPEQQLVEVQVPVSVVWGEEDPWERIEWGRQFVTGSKYPSIEEFVPLPGVGHCPQDEAPHLVHPVIQRFVQRHWP